MKSGLHRWFLVIGLAVGSSCVHRHAEKPEPDPGPDAQRKIELNIPITLGRATAIDSANWPTVGGVELGKMLFFDKRLSADNSVSCASCHKPERAFSDTVQFSLGVNGSKGIRNAMTLQNLVFEKNLFWDGRKQKLWEQALVPIQDPLEMAHNLADMVSRLSSISEYQSKFKAAFNSNSITADLVGKAIAQFETTLLSGNSKYDRYIMGTDTFTSAEKRGEQLFFTHPIVNRNLNLRGGNCGDCHLHGTLGGSQIGFQGFKNNGLQTQFRAGSDLGLEVVTGNQADRGKFKVPSLRNIAATAPYMHNGSLKTLEAVMDHYNHPDLFSRPYVDGLIAEASNEDQLLATHLALTPQEKADIISFLKTLTDEEYLEKHKK